MNIDIDNHRGDATNFEQSKKVIPYISFIIPALNEEIRIKRCIEAVQSLDFPCDLYEIIVVDNGSVDNTAKIARGCGAKVIRALPQNRSVSRNAGVKVSTGEVICFIDADCVVRSDWLQKLNHIFKDLSIAAVQSCILPTNDHSIDPPLAVSLEHMGLPFLDTKACAVRRTVFDHVGGFDQSLNRCEDIDFAWKINSWGYKIVYPNELIAFGAIPENFLSVVNRSIETAKALTVLYRKWNIATDVCGGAKQYFKMAYRLFVIRKCNRSLSSWILWVVGDLFTLIYQRANYIPEFFAPPINFAKSFFIRVAKEVLILRISLVRFARLFS